MCTRSRRRPDSTAGDGRRCHLRTRRSLPLSVPSDKAEKNTFNPLNSPDSPSSFIFIQLGCKLELHLLLQTRFLGPSGGKCNYSFSLCPVPKNASGKRPDTSPVVSRAASQQRGQLAKGNQALQVPSVALYPSRKKVPVKDLPPFGKTQLRLSTQAFHVHLWYSRVKQQLV